MLASVPIQNEQNSLPGRLNSVLSTTSSTKSSSRGYLWGTENRKHFTLSKQNNSI